MFNKKSCMILKRLKNTYGDVECTLDAKEDPWQLLVAAILAAQCTDARVNLVTPRLFEVFPDVNDFAKSSPQKIEPYIASCGLFRMKAKSIFCSAKMLIDDFDGKIPNQEELLLKLPGVGRKIANLLLSECFGIPAIVVDTHCGRISRLLGFTHEKNPIKIESALMKVISQKEWSNWGHYMVAHGRAVCKARKPDCYNCSLSDLCAHGKLITSIGA